MDGNEQMSLGEWSEAAYDAMCIRARDSNLDPVTLLATDYLNHFNEIVMLLEMVADMPDILEDVKEWQPKGYCDHFRDSTIADREIAVEAYAVVPPMYKVPFEATIDAIDQLIAVSVKRLDETVAEGNSDLIREIAVTRSRNIQRLMDSASAIMHGSAKQLDQDEIDRMMES